MTLTKRRNVLLPLVGLVASVLVGTATPATASSPSVPPGCSGSTAAFESSAPTPIPDNSAGAVEATQSVSGLGTYLWDIDLTTQLTHTYSGDLEITLISPAGTEVRIANPNLANGQDDAFLGTVWDDDAGDPVTDHDPWVAVGTVATLTPEAAMGAFIGEDPNGVWRLRMIDAFPGDMGTLNSWTLTILSLTSAPAKTTRIQEPSAPAPLVDDGTFTYDIVVPDSPGPISKVSLLTNFTHPATTELNIRLRSPAGTGTEITLSSGNSFVPGHYDFDDDRRPVTEGPTSGAAPEGAFGAFIGEDPTGTWTLTIEDTVAGLTGAFTFAWLSIESATCNDVTPTPSGQALYGAGNRIVGLDLVPTLYRIDPVTGAPTVVGPLTGMVGVQAMDMDPTTGVLYAVDADRSLFKVNKTTGAATLVGLTGLAIGFPDTSMTFDLDGNLYATSGSGKQVYKINKQTGAATAVGAGELIDPASAIGYDPASDTLYTRQVGDDPSYETVNRTTGAGTEGAVAWQPEAFMTAELEFDRNGQGYSIGFLDDPVTFIPTNALVASDPPSVANWSYADTGIPTLMGDGLVALAFDVGPPVAVPDAFSTGESTSLMVNGVLDNDTDPDSDLTASVVTPPSHGALALKTDGSFTYTPTPNYAGSDSFTYAASDGVSSSQATVTLTVGPLAPTVGLVDVTQGKWYLRNSGGAITSFFYGNPGDLPISGDWDGDGVDTPGLYRQSDGFFYARNLNTQGPADAECFAGDPSDIPVVGDWDGDGDDNLGIYRPSEQKFYLFTTTCTGSPMGAAQIVLAFGDPGDKPTSGDWDGDGITEIGLHRESTGFFYWRNSLTTGAGDGAIFFGDPNDRFVTGDWGTVDNIDSPAIFRPGDLKFYFRHTLTQGNADSQFVFSGAAASWLPVSGKFGLG